MAIQAMSIRWVWVALVAALSFTAIKIKLDLDATRATLSQEKAKYSRARAEAAEALARVSEQYRQQEQALQAAAHQARRERDAQIAASRVVADSLRERLRIYTEPPAADYSLAPTAASLRPFATGSFGALIRDEAPDAARVLIDEADRAEVIRLELIRMYRLYDEARGKHGIVSDAN